MGTKAQKKRRKKNYTVAPGRPPTEFELLWKEKPNPAIITVPLIYGQTPSRLNTIVTNFTDSD